MKTRIEPQLVRAALTGLLMLAAQLTQAAVIEAWVHRYDGPSSSNDYAQAVAVDGSGNVIVTGSSYNGTNYDYYTAKYTAANGAVVWEKRYNGPSNSEDRARALAVDGSGNVVVTGYSRNGVTNDNVDYYTVKYAAADGALLWERRYNGPANSDDNAWAVALDGGGNAIVTGFSYSYEGGWGFCTIKYGSADGALQWEKRYEGAQRYSDSSVAVAVDGSGNAAVTGDTGFSSNRDYYTAKYSAADGTLLWTNRYNGPADAHDNPRAVVVDANGNVVVTGKSWGTNCCNYDYYTAKYRAVDGVRLWENRYAGPASDDEAQAVVVDRGGNVVVTGNSSTKYYTAKYASDSGALLWEKQGGWFNLSYARAVAVDESSNVVVTGYSYSGSQYVFYTAKYAATNGALLWEKVYNGPANGDVQMENARSLALGPNGMVAITGSSGGSTFFDYTTVVYWEKLPALTIERDGNGGYFLRCAGPANFTYRMQRATSFSGPWDTLATRTAPASGLLEYHDTNAPPAQAFYRTAQP